MHTPPPSRPSLVPILALVQAVAGCTNLPAPEPGATTAEPAPDVPWIADNGDGTYTNPVLFADYSDPDVVRVGGDYYLTASSFANVPGLPILHSRDLVNWTIIGHALPRLVPEDHFALPRHGAGVWAPAFRYRAGRFYIVYPDPDFGLYMVSASDPRGPWSEPVLMCAGKGLIDPCPFWDDDGRAYLVHAWAKSRSGTNNLITLRRMRPDGTRVLDEGEVIIDGHQIPGWTTLEGPKLYKRDGWYYVFAPAGGVRDGWQGVFRARDIHGPYEHRIVLAQGQTAINGPHQGAWVDTPAGQDWFIHFQDRGVFGRITHLQPMVWRDGWPVMGADPDGDGTGEPVLRHAKPALPRQPVAAPQVGDEFDGPALGRAWQWQGNPRPAWASLSARPGWLRLAAAPAPANLFRAPNLLTQKFPGPAFSVTAALEFAPARTGDAAGLIVTGDSQAWIGLVRTASGVRVVLGERLKANAEEGGAGREIAGQDLAALDDGAPVRMVLRLEVRAADHEGRPGHGAQCTFAFSRDGEAFEPLDADHAFAATAGRWVGAKFGVFAVAPAEAPAASAAPGHADFAWVRVRPPPS